MNTDNNKYIEKITEINTLLHFVENNILEELLQERYIKVLRFQKALIRDMDRKGRKIPEQIEKVIYFNNSSDFSLCNLIFFKLPWF